MRVHELIHLVVSCGSDTIETCAKSGPNQAPGPYHVAGCNARIGVQACNRHGAERVRDLSSGWVEFNRYSCNRGVNNCENSFTPSFISPRYILNRQPRKMEVKPSNFSGISLEFEQDRCKLSTPYRNTSTH